MEFLTPYIHFSLVILSLVFGLQLFTTSARQKSSKTILGIYMIVIGLYYIANASFITVPLGMYGFCQYLIPMFLLSFNPFYYLYVRSLSDPEFRFRPKFYLHWIPSLSFALIALISVIGNFDVGDFFIPYNKGYTLDDVLMVYTKIPSLIFAIVVYYLQIFIYVTLIIKMLLRHQKNVNQYFSYSENISLRWLWIFLLIYLSFTFFDAAIYFIPALQKMKFMYFIIMLVFTVFLGFFGIRQKDIYSESNYSPEDLAFDPKLSVLNIQGEADLQSNSDNSPEAFPEAEVQVQAPANEVDDKKYSGSSLSDEFKTALLERIHLLLTQKKVYLDPELSINDVAQMLDTNYKYISQVINEKTEKNFFQFVNEFRIAQAIEMLKSPKYNHLSLEGISSEVGFHSRSSFNQAFKKITGKTPTEYKKESQSL